MTAAELARTCGVARSTIFEWLHRGRLPAGVAHDPPEHRQVFRVNLAELKAWQAARQ